MRLLPDIITNISTETGKWLVESIDKLAVVSNNGYAKLQSGRISRGRMTMADISDEKETEAWTEQVWGGDNKEASEQWPQVLRRQRPELANITTTKQAQKKRRPPLNSPVDIFDNPPVFLTIKDVRKQSTAEDNGFKRLTPKKEMAGGKMMNSPVWSAALLTYERGISPSNSPHHCCGGSENQNNTLA